MVTALEPFRRQLLDERRRLLRQVAHVEEDLRWLDQNVETEMLEEGQEETLARFLVRLDDRDRVEIEAIDAALLRIAKGDYGMCADCATLIPAPRLRSIPTARRCVECEEEAERLRRR